MVSDTGPEEDICRLSPYPLGIGDILGTQQLVVDGFVFTCFWLVSKDEDELSGPCVGYPSSKALG